MYKIGDIFYLDNEFNLRVDFCNRNNLFIAEITADEKGRRFQIQTIPELPEKEQLCQEHSNLINWFDSEYTYKEQKYRRLVMLNKVDDDGVDASVKLTSLYEEAEEKRARIQELESLINK